MHPKNMYRVIFALRLRLSNTSKGELRFLIIWLDPSGNGPSIEPIDKSRAIDLRPGDTFHHDELGLETVEEVSAFRDLMISDGDLKTIQKRGEGYVYKLAASRS